jgi:hypothetical protein
VSRLYVAKDDEKKTGHGNASIAVPQAPSPTTSSEKQNVVQTGRGKVSFPNPFPSLRVIFYPDTALILWPCAAPYAVWYCIQISIPLIYGSQYGFSTLNLSLCFLTGAAGLILGGLIAGRLMGWSFQRTADKARLPHDKKAVNFVHFPIEEARSTGSIIIMLISISAVAGYG